MRLLNLELKNIGPFKSAELDFIGDGNEEQPPVTIITGENGTGKTVILDAIRGILLGKNNQKIVDRNIVREKDFRVQLTLKQSESSFFEFPDVLLTTQQKRDASFILDNNSIEKYFDEYVEVFPKWIIGYWTANTSHETLEIKQLVVPNIEDFLKNALDGIQRNAEVTELITFFEYLETSSGTKEKELGKAMFDIVKKIIKKGIVGEFSKVVRQTLTPYVFQLGHEIELNKLSSGNLYLIQRMIGLLGQMQAVAQLHDLPLEDICKTPGVLLIDEAENHLHPKWQKTFLNDILDIFPNLQIIVTTHSPFIVSSVENARVYVCESRIDHAAIVDRTSDYSNRPIEEVLVSPVFDTTPFSSKITDLLERRKAAIINGNKDLENEIEAELKRLNPNHFAYLDIEQMLESMTN